MARVVAPICVVLVPVSACSGKGAPQASPTTSSPTATGGSVVATTPPRPTGTKACPTVSSLAGWPTTAPPALEAFACIDDAFAAGTPAQMSMITAGGGRRPGGGHDVPTRRITTVRVLGTHEVRVTTDLTEDGGAVITRTCRGFEVHADGLHGTDCS